ncbi:hypothetical protein ACODM8_15335 [Vibrio ostreicida]|uniref:Dethiobiotin synthetase n=1 Tax=Vibrio ostreicida TaxID=526588 RepID=A0ABT8BRB8_9VIBR|nr:hypothetical protein [Vibrio ostreicida]MDN3609671.1 hypothetical protein [Vibrio ostreicida]MDN3610997.1 hypothetical protein [Vibrio ostreicida]NPD09497.1 hypothetical protein [Vibrio ostreicida]
MVEASNYQMAIDLLCCHLGISQQDAMEQLGLASKQENQSHISDMQQALVGIDVEK